MVDVNGPLPWPLPWLLLAIVSALAVSLLTVLSALLERSGPIRVRHFVEEAGGRLRALIDHPLRFEAFRYLLSLLTRVTFAALAVVAVVLGERFGLAPTWAAGASLLALSVLALVLELVNRILVGRDPESALRRFTGIYRVALAVLTPLVAVLAPILPGAAVERLEGQEDTEASEEEIEAFIAVGAREGILEPGEEALVRGVVDFGDTQVKSVMTPRIDIISASVETSLDELMTLFIDCHHSRLPLFRDSIDHVVGIVHIRDLVRGVATVPHPQAGELARPAYFVPLTKPLDELLREFQARYQQMAIVVDEYGGTAGLVTLEDLVEEIVGDIADEHERGQEGVQALPDGSWRLEGRTHLEDLEELFDIDLEDGPYETVGGLILSLVGEVPAFGRVIEHEGLRLTVEQVSERRIETVRVERLVPGEEVRDA